MRAGIAALPDGTYRFAELGRSLDVSVEITIEGSEMRLRFDSPPQVRAGIRTVGPSPRPRFPAGGRLNPDRVRS